MESKQMISEEQWALLTDDLLCDFRDGLDKAFPLPSQAQPTYYNFYFFKTGLAGFYYALESACTKNNAFEFYEYLIKTPWQNSDTIDDLILTEMYRRGIIAEGDEEDIERYFDLEFIKDKEL